MENDENRKAFLKVLNSSPMYKHIGMKVIEAGEGKSKLMMSVSPELLNVYGMLHGGAVASLLDSACSIAAGTFLEPGEICVTVDLRVNFIANLSSGEIIAEGTLIHKGKQTCVARAEARDQGGNLIAAAMSTHLVCAYEDVRVTRRAE
jgi:uncharacterized protein (TIGR00369 family)